MTAAREPAARHPRSAMPTAAEATVRDDQARPRDDVAAAGDPVRPGTVLDGRYRLEELVGLGGTASVYRGTDLLLDRPVAVKMFHPHLATMTMVGRQRQEMQIVARLRHPNLILLHDARDGAEQPAYLVLEYVQGPTLSRRIEAGPLTAGEVAIIGAGIAGALQTVHSGDLVHRDVKPANILLGADGEAKLSDFGIARVVDSERVTGSADVVGTAPYMSPEQARGTTVGPASDIYALGLVLLEALTGHREFPGGPVEAAVARLLRDPVIPDTLPPGWPPLLRTMTAPVPEDRPSAGQVAAQLRALRDGDLGGGTASGRHGPRGTFEPGTVRGDTVPDDPASPVAVPAGRRARRFPKRAVLAGTGVAAAVLATFATFGVLSSGGDSAPGTPIVGTGSAVPSAGTREAAAPATTAGRASTAAVRVSKVASATAPTVRRTAPAVATVSTPAPTAPTQAPAPPAAPAPTTEPPAAPAPVDAPPANGNRAGNGNGNGAGNGNGNGNGAGNGAGNGNGKPPAKGH